MAMVRRPSVALSGKATALLLPSPASTLNASFLSLWLHCVELLPSHLDNNTQSLRTP